jgi:release factor glutamine methyltransferase
MTTAADALRQGVLRLRECGIDTAPTDARLLLAQAMAIAPDRLTLHLADTLDDRHRQRFDAAIAARAAHQPVAQILGYRDFWGHRFKVTADTLDPRPDTETLVAAALEQPFFSVLDLGTGTGCILLSLLAERPAARGLGVDLSPKALAVAVENARALGLSARATFKQSDWLSAVTGRFDLIVSNPPYIAADEMPGLAPDVRDWEPHLALTPGGDGLDPYRILARSAPSRLMPGGWLRVEIGPTQAAAVSGLFLAAGLTDLSVRPDLDGRDRVVQAMKPYDDTGCGTA